MSQEPKKYYVRFSSLEDMPRINEFYKENPHKNVCERNTDLMERLADNGAITIIEDESGKIVGASISYPLVVEKDGMEEYKWSEIGTTRMSLNGFPGLFNVMIAMQSLRAYLVEPPEEKFVCQMEGAPVRAMAAKLGFRPFTPTQQIIDISDATLSAVTSSGSENWYQAGPEALPVMAKLMRDAIDKPYLENPKTGERIVLDFSKSRFFRLFEEEIRNLADRDFGSVDAPKEDNGLAKNRQAWMRWYFK